MAQWVKAPAKLSFDLRCMTSEEWARRQVHTRTTNKCLRQVCLYEIQTPKINPPPKKKGATLGSSVVACIYNPRTQEAKAGLWQV